MRAAQLGSLLKGAEFAFDREKVWSENGGNYEYKLAGWRAFFMRYQSMIFTS